MKGGLSYYMDSVAEIRKDLEENIGKSVILKADKGRKRIVTREGVLESAYPNLFVVKISNEFNSIRRVSYTYSDVLTSTVKVTVCDEPEKQTKIS
ncbi:MAG TPA: Veg family protein [Tissierellaceae bacterium]|nr:Veg family protein [Tissierellaceae bacterium]